MIGGNREALPATIVVASLAGEFGAREHLLTAGAFVITIVPLVVFFACSASLCEDIYRRIREGLAGGDQDASTSLISTTAPLGDGRLSRLYPLRPTASRS